MVICFACGSIYTSDEELCLCGEKIIDENGVNK
jgi:hypothetical protein